MLGIGLDIMSVAMHNASLPYPRAQDTMELGAWTQRTLTAQGWRSVLWVPTVGARAARFVAVAGSLTNRIATSPDGVSWTQLAAPNDASNWHGLAYSPSLDRLVSVSDTATTAYMTSDDGGATWTARAFANSLMRRAICWSPELNLFVVIARNGAVGTALYTSPDGITWTSRTIPEANSWLAVTWSKELALFVAVASTGTNRVMTSPDGTTWTARAAATDGAWGDVVWAKERGILVAVSTTSTKELMTSPDGTTWTQGSDISSSATPNKLIWCKEIGLFCAIGSGTIPAIWLSKNGINWTPTTSQSAGNCVAWSPTLGLIVGLGAAVFGAQSSVALGDATTL